MAGHPRASMQASRRGQVEHARVAAHLQEHGGECAQPRSLFRDPQGVGKLAYVRDENVPRFKSTKGKKTGRIGEACFREDLTGADPEYRPSGIPLSGEACDAQREASHRACIAGVGAVDFGKRGLWQAAAKSVVEAPRSRPERGGKLRLHRNSCLAQNHAAGPGCGDGDFEALR